MGMTVGSLVCLEGGAIGVSDRLDVGHMEGQARQVLTCSTKGQSCVN